MQNKAAIYILSSLLLPFVGSSQQVKRSNGLLRISEVLLQLPYSSSVAIENSTATPSIKPIPQRRILSSLAVATSNFKCTASDSRTGNA